jgi:DNA-binding beta-propeller fold protein YncE
MSEFSLQVGHARARLAQVCVALFTASLVAGCGSNYRPVVSPINPSGPPAQVAAFAIAVSSTGSTTPGVASVIDYSGDTVQAQATIGPGPLGFTVDQTGGNGYALNSDGTLTSFQIGVSEPQQKNIQFITLPPAANIVNVFSPSSGLFTADLNGNAVDVFNSLPASFKLAIPVVATPVTTVGPAIPGARNYAISQNFNDATGVACNVSPRTVGVTGFASAIENSTLTISTKIPVGVCPVFGVESPDGRRVFVLNRGDDTITVINSQNNALDNDCPPPAGCVNRSGQTYFSHPSLPLSTSAGLAGAGVPAIAGPVYAEMNSATQQLVVADYDGNAVSIIDVSLDEYGNDSPTFGTTYSVPVGTNPASVTVLYDGSRAYTANQTDSTVSEVNVQSHSLVKSLGVTGHPRSVVSVQNSIYGKVYVASPDTPYLTVIRTDQDIIDTTVLLQGNVLDVRTSNQNGGSGNAIVSSRMPGFGQPCNLSPSQLGSAALTLQRCRAQVQ